MFSYMPLTASKRTKLLTRRSPSCGGGALCTTKEIFPCCVTFPQDRESEKLHCVRITSGLHIGKTFLNIVLYHHVYAKELDVRECIRCSLGADRGDGFRCHLPDIAYAHDVVSKYILNSGPTG
jgi:hypothetical protein